ncbi:hypothetical protein EYV94_11155 [Puteibacter caeruleilacunae]|nr:hypothetical protein EYV94_11155 [Puteibacter caeruleilacunae]
MKKNIHLLVILIVLVISSVWLYQKQNPLNRLYQLAGENKKELQAVIEHYSTQDTCGQKFQAMQFILGGLPYHHSAVYHWYNPQGQITTIVPREFKSSGKIREYIQENQLRRKQDTSIFHAASLRHDFLINNIDEAYKSWQQLPWRDSISFDIFKEYTLPYSIGNEVTQEWRSVFQEKYPEIKDSILTMRDPVKIARLFKRKLSVWRWYSDRSFVLSPNQNVEELFKYQQVDCTNYAHLMVMACRSFGIPAAVDEIPLWGNRNSSHCECSVFTLDNKWQQLGDGVWCNVTYDGRRAAKVFKKTYSPQTWTLAQNVDDPDAIPPLLRSALYVDATADYCPAQDIAFSVDTLAASEDYVYATVFNNGRWEAVHWSELTDGKFNFTDMAPYVVYLPAYYKDGSYIQAQYPLMVSKEGEVKVYNISDQKVPQIHIGRWTLKRKMEQKINVDDKIYLYIWDKEWKYHSQSKVTDKGIYFKDVPEGTICRLESIQNSMKARIFSVEGEKVFWW